MLLYSNVILDGTRPYFKNDKNCQKSHMKSIMIYAYFSPNYPIQQRMYAFLILCELR